MNQKKYELEQYISANEAMYMKYIAMESYLQQGFIEKMRASHLQKEVLRELI